MADPFDVERARLERLHRQTQRDAAFQAFGRWCLDTMREEGGCDIDGGWAQDKAIELGLLVWVEAAEPCHPDCRCVEYHGEFPVRCLRDVDAV